MKKIILATIIALGLTTTVQADTVCKVYKVVTNYNTEHIKTPITTSYQERKYYNVQCGTTLIDIPNSNNMKEVKQYCSGSKLITKYKTSYTYRNIKTVIDYTNHYVYNNQDYITSSSKPLKRVIIND